MVNTFFHQQSFTYEKGNLLPAAHWHFRHRRLRLLLSR